MARLSAIRGDDFQRTFIWKDPEGEPIDLTGYVVLFSVTDGDTTTNYTGGDGVTITEDEGRMDVLIEDDVTEEWGNDLTYRLRVISSDDIVTTLARGRLAVS